MKPADISEILLKRGKRVCTSADIRELSGGAYLSAISNLLNTHWLVPLKGFRGIYYVRDPEERVRSFFKLDSFSILTLALNSALGSHWYFGRVTALSLAGIIHQPVSAYYVINKKINRRFESPIFGRVVLLKTTSQITSTCGIISKQHKGVVYATCILERNVADNLYLYTHGHASIDQVKNLMNYGPDKRKIRKIISSCYPARSAKKMLSALER